MSANSHLTKSLVIAISILLAHQRLVGQVASTPPSSPVPSQSTQSPTLLAEGGLPFSWRGEGLFQEGEVWTFTKGAVETNEMVMMADLLIYNSTSGIMKAQGHIKISLQALDFYSERIEYDWFKKSGTADVVRLDLPPTWTIKSDRVTFNNFRQWNFKTVTVTPCSEIDPGWSASMSELDLDLDSYAQLWNLRLAIGAVPVPIYLPYLIYPSQTKRTSGFLPPVIGSSSLLGTKFGLNYYQVLGDSADATLSPTWYSKEGILWGTELRWLISNQHQGNFTGEIIRSQSLNKLRYRFSLNESFKNQSGWNFYLRSNESSDNLMDIDYGSGISALSGTSHASNLLVEKNYQWGRLTMKAFSNRAFIQSDTEGDRIYNLNFPNSFYKQLLPEITLQTKALSLNSTFIDMKFSIGSFNYLATKTDETKTINSRWQRSDLALHAYGALFDLGPSKWSFELLGRGTYYTHSYTNPVFDLSSIYATTFNDATSQDNPFQLIAPAQTRTLFSGKIEAKLPQYGRIYGPNGERQTSNRYKHIIEPYFTFMNNSQFSGLALSPRFDAVDSYPGVDTTPIGEKSIALGINQHLLTQFPGEVFFMSHLKLDLAAKYHFNPVVLYDGTYQKGWGSLEGLLSYEPSKNIRLSLRNSSSFSNRGSDRQAVVDFIQEDTSYIGLSYYRSELSLTSNPQHGVQIAGLQRLFGDKFRFEYKINYTLPETNSNYSTGINYGEIGLAYVEPCRAFIIKISKVPVSLIGMNIKKDNRIDLILNLRGLGDLFDFRR